MEQLVTICQNFIKTGTPKQAKQAVKCLHMNATDTQENVFLHVLDIVKGNLNGPKSDAYLTAIVSLGHIACLLPDKYPIHIKNLVSRNIVKQLLMKEVEENHTSEEPWVEFEDLALETRCKVEAMKMIARWLVGLKDDTISAQKTFRMLNAHITSKGDLHESGKLSTAECSWLRLAAGCAMLKICEQKGVGDVYTVEQFYNLSQLVVDDVKQVREQFVAKLHKGLAKGVPFKCLPLDFMGFYVLSGLETDKKLKEISKRYLLTDIAKRRECIKALSISGGDNTDQLPNLMPDYMLCFAVMVLTHLPLYENNKDVQVLEQLKNALWFILEPLMVKNENFSLQFYKLLLEMMKCHIDASDQPSEVLNHKMWALCDLSLTIIMSKATSYNDFNKEFPFKPTVPPLYFKPHPEGPKFENSTTYIPAEMALLPKTKIGMPVGWQSKRGRTKSIEDSKSPQDTLASTLLNEENGNHVQDDAPSTRKRMTKTAEENTLISNNGENNDSSEGPTAAKKMSLSEPISPANEEASSEITTGGRPKRSRR
jgi:sister-chromatid-cohesion protein PDS5